MVKNIMLDYIELVEFLGKVLGPDYEIVLFDLRNNKNEIIALSNGRISERSIGDPITEHIQSKIDDREYERSDYIVNYRGIVRGNKFIRCSTKFITDDEDKLIGILCVNFDDTRFEKISSEILKLCHPDSLVERIKFERIDDSSILESTESLDLSIFDIANKIINNILSNIDTPIEKLNMDSKINIVSTLNSKGIFELKSSIPLVASKLKISEATLYRYINNLEK